MAAMDIYDICINENLNSVFGSARELGDEPQKCYVETAKDTVIENGAKKQKVWRVLLGNSWYKYAVPSHHTCDSNERLHLQISAPIFPKPLGECSGPVHGSLGASLTYQ
eukprot:scaffold1951_cov100-Cylindrotheca_fusiformis.AAC.1